MDPGGHYAAIVATCVAVAGCHKPEAPPPSSAVQDLTKGKARVLSNPPGADIDIGGIATGVVTPSEVTVEVGKDNRITVHKPGFLRATQVTNPDLNQTPEVRFDLQPAAPVHVETAPPGAEVFLGNEQLLSATPGTIEGLPVGEHVLLLKLKGSANTWQRLKVPDSKPIEISVKLPPAVLLDVASEPPSAEIYLDGVDTGVVTPTNEFAISAGKAHRVELRKPGFASAHKIVPAAEAGQRLEISLTLGEQKLLDLRAQIRKLEADLKKWTAIRDRLDRKQGKDFVMKRDARKELALKRQFEEADEQVQTITDELDSAKDALEEAQAR
jgi:hypothetical protein